MIIVPRQTIFSRRSFLILFILILGIMAHGFMINDSFKTLDDQYSIVENKDIKSFTNLTKIFLNSFFGDHSYYRPLVAFSFMLEYHGYGLDARFYYLTNLMIHLMTSLIIFFLIELFFQDSKKSFLVALLFAIHPIHWEAISNISGWAILLSSLFYLGSFYLFCLSLRKRFPFFLLIFSFLSFFFALLSKESSVSLPLVLLCYIFIFYRQDKKNFSKAFGRVLFYWLFLVFYFFLRNYLGITNVYFWASPQDNLLAFLSFLRSLITHFRLFIWPLGLHFDRSRIIFHSFGDPDVILTLVFFGLFFVGLFWLRKRITRFVFFWILWFFIELVTVSQILVAVTIQAGVISTADHFLYTASLGIFVLAVMGGYWFIEKAIKTKVISRTVMLFILAGVYGFFLLCAIQQNVYARHQITMFEQTLRYAPYNIRIQNSLALAFVHYGLFEEAEKRFRKVLELEPANIRARIGLGKALCDQNKYWEGIEEYEKVSDAGNLNDLLKKNILLSYNIILQKYQSRLDKEPGNAQLHYSLGVVYVKMNRLQEAMHAFEKTIELNPFHKDALFNLASGYQSMGDNKKSIEYFERMLLSKETNPKLDQHAFRQLSDLYRLLGDHEKTLFYQQVLDATLRNP